MSSPSASYMREWRKRNYKHMLEYEAKRRERTRTLRDTKAALKAVREPKIPFAQMVKTFGGALRPVASKASQFGVMAFAPSRGTMNGRPLWT